MGRLFVIWVKQDGEWESRGEPMDERAAYKEAGECRAYGVAAKAVPVGRRPDEQKAAAS